MPPPQATQLRVRNKSFRQQVLDAVSRSAATIVSQNYDNLRFPETLAHRFSRNAKNVALRVLFALNPRQTSARAARARDRTEHLLKDEDAWQHAYDLLGDEY